MMCGCDGQPTARGLANGNRMGLAGRGKQSNGADQAAAVSDLAGHIAGITLHEGVFPPLSGRVEAGRGETGPPLAPGLRLQRLSERGGGGGFVDVPPSLDEPAITTLGRLWRPVRSALSARAGESLRQTPDRVCRPGAW